MSGGNELLRKDEPGPTCPSDQMRLDTPHGRLVHLRLISYFAAILRPQAKASDGTYVLVDSLLPVGLEPLLEEVLVV